MIFRLFFIPIIVASISACAPKITNDEDFQEGLLHSQQLSKRYGHISGRYEKSYLNYLQKRLVNAIPDEYRSETNYKFIVLNTSDPVASAAGGGFILISRGLIQALNTEVELAFIIAHELAHQFLGHTKLHLQKTRAGVLHSYQKDLEIIADKYAVAMLALAGYDPRPAVQALEKASRMLLANTSDTYRKKYGIHTHPELRVRIREITKLIEKSHWSPPGTVNRRDYNRFRLLLAAYRK